MPMFNVQLDLRPCYTCGAYVQADHLGKHEAQHVKTDRFINDLRLEVLEYKGKIDDLFVAINEAQQRLDDENLARKQQLDQEHAERAAIISEPSNVGAAGIPLHALQDLADDNVPF